MEQALSLEFLLRMNIILVKQMVRGWNRDDPAQREPD